MSESRRSTALPPAWSDDDEDIRGNGAELIIDSAQADDTEEHAGEALSPVQNEEDEPQQGEAAAGEDDGNTKKKRAGLKRTVPKLDANRIKSKRGFPALPTLMEKVKFKGKGHEAADLRLLMSNLEHWGHRLFPKCTFEELLERLERLGHQKTVQNCVNRMRLGLPVTDADYAAYVEREGQSDGEGAVAAGGNDNDGDDDDDVANVPPMDTDSAPPVVDITPSSQAAGTRSCGPGALTEEQLERIRQNRLRALERRHKLTPAPESISESASISAPVTAPISGPQTGEQHVTAPHDAEILAAPRSESPAEVNSESPVDATSELQMEAESEFHGEADSKLQREADSESQMETNDDAAPVLLNLDSQEADASNSRREVQRLLQRMLAELVSKSAQEVEEHAGRVVETPVSDRSLVDIEVGEDPLQTLRLD